MFKDFIIKINDVLQWEPYMIFVDVWYTEHIKRQTKDKKLNIYMGSLPFLIEIIIKTIYYLITWPLYVIVKLVWLVFIGICFPQTWFE